MHECKNCRKRGLFLRLVNGLCKDCINKLPSANTINNSTICQESKKNLIKNTWGLSVIDSFIIHPDIQDLLWFCNGKQCNCDEKEPSAIHTNLPIEYCQHTDQPDYYPTYVSLTPKQRYTYLKMLENPYNEIDIGYVFLLYYGLERHLILGNFDKAFDVILKLRNAHLNKSFQNYSFTALITAALLKQRTDLCVQILEKPNRDNVLFINHFILYKILTNSKISAKELMLYARDFGYTNTHYIKDYPDLFEKNLINNLQITPLAPYLDINVKKVSKVNRCFFANMSFFSEKIQFSDYISYTSFRMKGLTELYRTHEQVKNELKQNRNSYNKQERPPAPKMIYYNPDYYPNINEYNEIVAKFDTLTTVPTTETLYDIHFSLNNVIISVYKYRDHPLALQHVIDLCKKDILLLRTHSRQFHLDGCHVDSYYKLCTIYEKQGNLDEAISLCKEAISNRFAINHDNEYFIKKYEKLIEKKYKG